MFIYLKIAGIFFLVYLWPVLPGYHSFFLYYNILITEGASNLIGLINCIKRITLKEIKNHPWFMKNLPRKLTVSTQAIYYYQRNNATFSGLQSVDDIMKIVGEARNPPPSSRAIPGFPWGDEDTDNKEEIVDGDNEDDDEEEYDKHVKQVDANGEFHISQPN